MKHTLKLLLCLLPLFVQGQRVTIELPRDVITEKRLKVVVDSLAKALGKVTPTPVPALEDCSQGPKVVRIADVTPTSLLLQFHGEGVTELEVSIYDLSGAKKHVQSFNPTSNKLAVTYSPLPAGLYKLLVKGLNCNGQDDEEFEIKDNSTGAIPPVVVPSNGEKVTIAQGFSEHLNLDWKKDGDGYLVSDLASPDQISGNYEYRYLIGSEVIKTGRGVLKNYPIASTSGRIVKYKIKPDKVLNQWEPLDGYYDPNAGQTFSNNTSVAFHTFTHPGKKGDFVNPFPAKYDPTTQQVQWGDYAEDFKLPSGHVYVADPRPWGIDYALRKGVTHISNFALPWDNINEVVKWKKLGKGYSDVQRIEIIFGIQKSGNTGELWPDNTSKDWWPNGAPSEEEGYQIAMRADISNALFIAEMSENESWLPPNSPVHKGFHRGLRERYEKEYGSKGIPYYICHDYIWLGGVKLNTGLGRDYYKRILKLPPSQQPANDYTPGGSLTETNLIVETVYLGAPDNVVTQPYELVFRLNYIKQLGYTPGTFIAYVHEWKPNNMNEITYPEGKMYAHAKIPLDPNTLIANGFLAHVHGKLFIEWGGAVKTPDKLLPRNWFGGAFFWYPNDGKSSFPYFKETEGYPTYYGYNGSTDIGYFSQKLFADTYGKVEGGADKYLRFRVDGGAWVNAQDEDYIDAYHDKRGFVHSRSKDGKTALYYLNCFVDNKSHTLEVELPDGKKWSGKVAGNGVHVKLL